MIVDAAGFDERILVRPRTARSNVEPIRISPFGPQEPTFVL